MIFLENIANQDREAVLKFQDNEICNSYFISAYRSFIHRKPNNDYLMWRHNFGFFSKLKELNCRETPSPILEIFCMWSFDCTWVLWTKFRQRWYMHFNRNRQYTEFHISNFWSRRSLRKKPRCFGPLEVDVQTNSDHKTHKNQTLLRQSLKRYLNQKELIHGRVMATISKLSPQSFLKGTLVWFCLYTPSPHSK